MDAKAGLLTALNMGLLALLWSGVKIQASAEAAKNFGAAATVFAILSIACAVLSARPRQSLPSIFSGKVKWVSPCNPISFYGYVASAYGSTEFEKFKRDADALTIAELAHEALEQHFLISHAVAGKSCWVSRAVYLLLAATFQTGIALVLGLYL
ncbi:MAG: hypothetical protein V4634_19780 [Pseudomonadota bacterium]